MKPTTRFVIGVGILIVLCFFISVISSVLFAPPVTYVVSFIGGGILGFAYAHIEFETLDHIFYD